MIQNHLTQQHLHRHPEKLDRFDKVLIFSKEWNLYWRPHGCGYTSVLSEAGVYKIQDAWNRICGAGPEKKITVIKAQ